MINDPIVFLESFIPQAAEKEKDVMAATWALEIEGTQSAADKKTECDFENISLFNNQTIYDHLKEWTQIQTLSSEMKRELAVLLLEFKKYSVQTDIQQAIAAKESEIILSYANFRPEINGQSVTENEIREILKKETDPIKRKQAWEASKAIGEIWAPQILDLVSLRNEAAESLGYRDYFQMQLDLQEVDEEWLFKTFDDLQIRSEIAYDSFLKEIEQNQCQRFNVSTQELGPWAWNEPFGQENPLDISDLDALVKNMDLCKTCSEFYQNMGFDIEPILQRSDLWERPGKNQHAFCINLDRGSDIRILTNLKNTLKWLETLLHELGHAVYEEGYDPTLPWTLKKPPHIATTEAMALIAGRQAYSPVIYSLFGFGQDHALVKKAQESLKRNQLIFSRWVLVMTYFEKELYQNPHQDLNKLWWQLVNKYQKIRIPPGREGKNDWATKYHIGVAPVYYYSYLLGEMLASSIEEALLKETGSSALTSQQTGMILNQKLFFPGSRMVWTELVQHVTGNPLNSDAWIKQFGS